ncbi:hypothetical protein MKK70_26665 [Methylobacterium sp. E-041]|uniref:hypothetical protein n=1 Tax=unclassified Methylobacterium TaxID=2615210 RepID=UPI001FBB307C|nr:MULTISPECIES: hypothetical protein [unclassified Methylobacterium]MCJ2108895.1 hypothetical protein [Methylobacterium sp. E-041]MCJ2110896.1 hypothetical protein [Methylobacterium sp. E-025]
MPKIPTVAVAGLWSAITVAALGVVAMDQAQSMRRAEAITAPAAIAADPATTAAIILTDATGNRYRKRVD